MIIIITIIILPKAPLFCVANAFRVTWSERKSECFLSVGHGVTKVNWPRRPGKTLYRDQATFAVKNLAPATKDTSGKSKELRKLHLKGTSSGDVVAFYIQLLLTMDTRKGSVKVQPFYKKMFYLIISATGSL